MSNAWRMPTFRGPELDALKAVLEVAASGCFADLLRLASYLGGSTF